MQRRFQTLSEMEVAAQTSGRPVAITSRDGVTLTVGRRAGRPVYFLLSQQVAERAAYANFRYISDRAA